MQLWHFIVLCIALALFLRFVLIPRLTLTSKELRPAEAIKRAGVLAMCRFLALASQVGAFSGACVWLGVWWMTRGTPGSLLEVQAGLEKVAGWRENVEQMALFSSSFLLLLAVVGFLLYFRRRAQVRANEAIQRVAQREFERLRDKLFAGELPNLPPTPEMLAIDRELERLSNTFHKLDEAFAAGDQKAAEQRRKSENAARELLAARAQLDILRRLDVKLDPEDVVIPPPRTRWEKLEQALMSRGLLVNCSRLRRAICYLLMALLVPSFVSLNARIHGDAVSVHEVRLGEQKYAFEQIEVKLQREKEQQAAEASAGAAEEAWRQTAEALAKAPEQTLPEDEAEAIQILAAKFEWQSATGIWMLSIPRQQVYEAQSLSARDGIIRRATARQSGQLAPTEAASKLTTADESLLRTAAREPQLKPATARGREFAAKLQTLAVRADDAFRQRLRAEAAAFRQTARSSDFQRAILGHISDTLLAEGPSPIGEMVDRTHREALRRHERTAAALGATEYARGSDVEAAARAAEPAGSAVSPNERAELNRLVRTEAARVGNPERLVSHFTDHPPSLHTLENRAAVSEAAKALAEFKERHPTTARRYSSMADAVTSYDDYFPGHAGADERTPASHIRRGFEQGTPIDVANLYDRPTTTTPNGGQNGGRPVSHLSGSRSASATRTSFVRARSFSMLRGFSRVGGVLIGREPENTNTLSLEDMRWESAGAGRLRLVVRQGGREFSSVPHRAEVVYRALLYAADQRPTAVTMAKADPLLELKILLHPALVDTQLGGEIVDLDRFVDEHTGRSGFRSEAEERVRAEHELYLLAWATRIGLLRGSSLDSTPGVAELFMVAERILARDDPKELAGVLGDKVGDPARSPLAVKSEFYDPVLVAAVKTAATNESVGAFKTVLRELLEREAKVLLDGLKSLTARSTLIEPVRNPALESRLLGALSPPPQFETWSGVRERPFTNQLADVLWLDNSPAPRPLDFMLQTAFTSPPQFGSARGSNGSNNSEETAYADEKPWEFPGIQEQIRATVFTSLTPANRIVLSNAVEFTLLQRFFRLAFQGRFGTDFPIAKLDRLARELETEVRPADFRTPRWNTRSGALEAVAAQSLMRMVFLAKGAGESGRAVAAIQACADLAATNVVRRQEWDERLDARMRQKAPETADWRKSWSDLWDKSVSTQLEWEREWATKVGTLTRVAAQPPLRASPLRESPLQQAADLASRTTTALQVRRALEVDKEARMDAEWRAGLRRFQD